jgi:hypothetical protein
MYKESLRVLLLSEVFYMINDSSERVFSSHAYYEKIRKRKSLSNKSSDKHFISYLHKKEKQMRK